MKKNINDKEIELMTLAKEYLINEGYELDFDKLNHILVDLSKGVVEFSFTDNSVTPSEDRAEDLIYMTIDTDYRVSISKNKVSINRNATETVTEYHEDYYGHEILNKKKTIDYCDKIHFYFMKENDKVLLKAVSSKETMYDNEFNPLRVVTNSYTSEFKSPSKINLLDGYPARIMGKQLINK